MEPIFLIIVVKSLIYAGFFAALAFFAGSETAITSLDKRGIAAAGGLEKFEYWTQKPERILSTVLVGTNLAMAGVGVIAVSIAADIVERNRALAWLLPALTPALVLVFGEILPKTFSRYHAVFVGKHSIGLLVSLSETFHFINKFLLKISESVIGPSLPSAEPSFKSSREIKRFLDATEGVARDTRTLLKNIIDFPSKRLKDVMVPRREIVAVDISRPREEIFDKIIKSGYSRLPAYRGTLERLAGIIYAKDIAFSYRNKDLIVIDDLLRPAYFHPENAFVEKLLRKFRQGRFHMAIIVDEHGLITGLVTIEDVVEEIVGEVWDEHDVRETNVTRFPDGSFVFKAKESLSAAASELKVPLPSEDYSTVGGWVTGICGEIPRVGDKITWGPLEIEIVEADNRRIKKIKILRTGKETS
ncbi:MAG: hemolysin family protein [Endomicrobiia bacterium]|nr:hemolysin family protein [Endomicrobiia bacterium]